MKDVLLILCIFFCFYTIVLGTIEKRPEISSSSEICPPSSSSSEVSTKVDGRDQEGNEIGDGNKPNSENCWMTLNATKYFKILDKIDERYARAREAVGLAMKENEFDKYMIEGFRRDRGIAVREMQSLHGKTWTIPSGVNLGGACMLRMPDSVLFFHRMKLRNNTRFRVNYLHNDLSDMVIRMHLSLNDLHLMGAYERSLTDKDPSVLIYAPAFGEVEFLMKDVTYKVEGRYRLIKNRLHIELITSDIMVDDVLMTYITKVIESSPVRVQKSNLGNFIVRLKNDLDKWIKDYFNDHLISADMDGIPHMDDLSNYDKEKGVVLEEFMDHAINRINSRLYRLHAENINLPSFTFKSIHGLQLKLYDGILCGLNTMYRRSVANGLKQSGGVRRIDSVVGFSNLKMVYKYEAVTPTGEPPIAGALTQSVNELSAHLALALLADPETVDLNIEFLGTLKPESLSVEGSANALLSHFKHLLENQIISVMSSTLAHGVRVLQTLPRCEPFVPGQVPEHKYQEIQPALSNQLTRSIKNKSDTIRKKYKQKSKKYIRSMTTIGNKY